MRTLLSALVFLALSTAFASEAVQLSPPEPTVNGMFHVSIDWGAMKRGWNPLQVIVAQPDGTLVSNAQVELSYDMASHSMNPPQAEIVANADGTFQVRVFLGMKGKYRFDFKITVGEKTDTLSVVQSAN